jgi:hypothetical protein
MSIQINPRRVFGSMRMLKSVMLVLALGLMGCEGDGDRPEASTSGAPFVGSGSFVTNCQNAIGSGNSTTTVNVDCGDRNSSVEAPATE